MKPTPARRSRWAAVFVPGVVAAGAGTVAGAAATVHGLDVPAMCWAFAACLLLTELRPVTWLRRGGPEVTASWTFAFALLLSAPLVLALGCLVVASLAGDLARRKPIARALFNAGQLSLSLAAGAGTLALLTGSALQPRQPSVGWVAAAALAAVVVFTVNGTLTGLALAQQTDRPIRVTVPWVVFLDVTTDGLMLGVAPILVLVGREAPALVPILLLTTWAVYRSAAIAEARRFAATHDVLTGLLNRAEFEREVGVARRIAEMRGEGFAILLIDLDAFKHVNDELGHDVGDALLQEVARALEDNRRPVDTVARLAGDEFAVLIRTVAHPDEARLVAERMHAALRRPHSLEGFPISVTASVGVAVFPEHGTDLDALVRHADLAMYSAKRAAGDDVRVYETPPERRTDRVRLLTELSRAIEHDELSLVYQPRVSLATGASTAAEALVRWDHPTLGRIRPDQFVPIAEQTDLVHALTEWVLATALADCRAWADEGFDLGVAVNVATPNLRDRRFVHRVAEALDRAGVEPGRLELEITERTVMADPGGAIATLARLHELGTHLAIDDFGTGYSSFATLRTLPVDRVKIDGSFVRSVLTDPRDLAIVQSLVDLARRLDLGTVAEGVETEDVRAILTHIGCDEAQGFLFMRPASAAELLRALRRSRLQVAGCTPE
ncbi:MAG: putative bifunctional diguanylate cyclase/phosphodiesterase [Acidimicrobiia bacterium]